MTAEQKSRFKKLEDTLDSEIDFSDIPELTTEQFARAIQPNLARKLVGVRLDVDVLYLAEEFWRRTHDTHKQDFARGHGK